MFAANNHQRLEQSAVDNDSVSTTLNRNMIQLLTLHCWHSSLHCFIDNSKSKSLLDLPSFHCIEL